MLRILLASKCCLSLCHLLAFIYWCSLEEK